MAEMVKALLNGKYEIILPKHRADRPEWYTEKGWEKARLDSMHKNLGQDDIIFYIGAEEGEMAALCQMWGAKVILVEPNPKAWSHIRSIWEANGLENPLAIWTGFASNVDKPAKEDSEFIEPLELTEDGWPKCSQEEMQAAHGFKELNKEADSFDQARIDSLSAMCQPTAISLDVEGSEWEVLKGAEQTIRKYKPKIWLSLHPEFLHEQYGIYGAELRKWLIDLGYKETLLDYPLHEVHLYYEPI